MLKLECKNGLSTISVSELSIPEGVECIVYYDDIWSLGVNGDWSISDKVTDPYLDLRRLDLIDQPIDPTDEDW